MMIDRNARVTGNGSQLAIFLGLTGGGIVISAIATGILLWVIAGQNAILKPEDILQPKYYYPLLLLQAITTFFIFFVPVYAFAIICFRNPNKYLGFNLHISNKQVILVLGILLLTFPLSATLGELTRLLPIPEKWRLTFKAMEASREAQEAMFIQITSFSKYILSLFIIALLPAVFEETFFRAGMQHLLTRWLKGPWAAIIITSFIFSIIHMSFYGFFVRFALGIILGLIYYYSGSLWLSVLFHFLFNGIQVTALYVMGAPGAKNVDDLEKNFPLWIGGMALVLVAYLFKIYKQASIVQRAKYAQEPLAENDLHPLSASQP